MTLRNLLLVLALSSFTHAEAAEPRIRFWGEIPFLAQGNIREFEETMGKTRDEARRELWDEFGSLYLPSVMYGSEAGRAAEALSRVLLQFDRLREEKVEFANRGMPEALERHFLAYFDQFYRDLGLTESERRAEFVRFSGWNESMLKARRGELSASDRAHLFREVMDGVDYLLYGSYTVIAGGEISLTLTAEDYKSGAVRSFQAEGPVQYAVAALAVELFEYVQANGRTPWKNPLQSLEWVLPPPHVVGNALPREAKLYCAGQGARIPFARELVLASQGGNYRKGGIPSILDRDIYLVADQQRFVENYFYFGKDRTGDDPRGPVRSQAGYGTIHPNFVCVKGEVAEVVRWEQDLYRLLRLSVRLPATSRARVQDAVEFLLVRLDAYGNRDWFGEKFSFASDAVSVLESEGVILSESLKREFATLE